MDTDIERPSTLSMMLVKLLTFTKISYRYAHTARAPSKLKESIEHLDITYFAIEDMIEISSEITRLPHVHIYI
jgi:hypothetical protein